MSIPCSISVLRPLLLAALALAAVLAGILVFHALTGARGGPLEPSGPEETVLRAARLAGIERAVIGAEEGAVVLRLDVPAITSAPDVDIAWQAGFASLAGAFPEAEQYIVQLFTDARPLMELRAGGPDVRAAVNADDSAELRAAIDPGYIVRSGEGAEPGEASEDVARVVPERERAAAHSLLTAAPEGATPLPADATAADVHLVGGYLDAKNRAAGLLGDEGPATDAATALSRAADDARRSAPPVAAPAHGESVVERYLQRLGVAVDAVTAAGRDGLLAEAEDLVGRGDRDAIARLRALVICAEALAVQGSAGVLSGAAELTRQVADTALEPGAPSDAVLAAVDSEDAPQDAVDVRTFGREPDRDVNVEESTGGSELPAVVLRLHARGGTPLSLGWSTANGGTTVAPGAWLACQRADGAVYWLAGDEGTVALTDASVLGWAFSLRRAAVVDAARCGRVQAFFPAE